MHYRLIRCLMALSVVAAPISICRAATPQQVDAAIKKGVAALWAMAEKNGGIWDTGRDPNDKSRAERDEWGGTTAICTYALLSAGESRNDPRFEKPLHFLERSKITGTYAIGLRANVWPFLDIRNPEIRAAITQDYTLLRQGARSAPDLPNVPAFYGYSVNEPRWWDHSCSQFAVLGMWAIDQAGGEIPMNYWKIIDTGWRKHQNGDGGWGYETARNESTVTMTAAGVATLFITDQFVHSDAGLNCQGNFVDPNIEKGLQYISAHFDNYDHLGDELGRFYYGWYGVERIGVASGRKYLGTIDWYEKGADALLSRQGKGVANGWGSGPVRGSYDTAMALLFLTRGRAPVSVNKLQYVIDTHGDAAKVANWNQRPRDVANITNWIGKQTEEYLNWQVVNLDAPVDELHDAPVLYMAGNQNVQLRDSDYDKLRQYIQEGGLIVGNADCNNENFVRFFETLGSKLFGQYQWEELPESSPVYAEQFKRSEWRSKPSLQVLSNGARLLMVLLPHEGRGGDYARHWQQTLYRDYEDSFELMDDLFIYAIDKGHAGGLRSKGQTYIIRPNTEPAAASTKVARLQYDGNWDPEPAGWTRLAAELHNSSHVKLDLDVTPIKLGQGRLNSDFALADLTGTDKVKLSDSQLAEIKQYVEKGGTLVVDACGGSEAFGQSMHEQLESLLPGSHLQPLPVTDEAFTSAFPMRTVAYRHFARSRIADLETPRLEGIQIKHRTAVYFSGEDLSVGLVGQQVDGIVGYTPGTALNIMVNIAVSVAPAQVRETAKHFAVLATSRAATKPAPATQPTPEP
jgi:hypothetical protein